MTLKTSNGPFNSEDFIALKTQALKNRTETYKSQIDKLKKLQTWIKNNESFIESALLADFNKPAFETQVSEIMIVLSEIKFFIENLESWMQDQSVTTPITLMGHTSHIRYDNKGVVLIISPWNYPFQLSINPLIAALAAGNSVVIKPSEITVHTSNLIQKLCSEVFTTSDVQVVLGGKEVTQNLLSFQFNHVFFTGSTAVGKIIAVQCAEKLIPYTLELGGKSPVIIDETADLDDAVHKIHWGKYLNRGQTCVAPDYILVHESVKNIFLDKMNRYIQSMPKTEIANIVNNFHNDRLLKLTENKIDFKTTEVLLSTAESTQDILMQSELFGPIAPVLSFNHFDEVMAIINTNPNPLALYIFSKNNKNIEKYLQNIPSGGVGINAIATHLGNHHLPFGGIGESGQGKYHGYYGFLEFSHQRAIIRQHFFSQMMRMVFPPYTPLKKNLLKLVKKLTT